MPITLDGTNGITTPMYNGSITANAVTPSVNMKNRIINGAMVINQRGFSGTVSGDPVYTLDRWYLTESQNSKFTISQNAGSVTPPVGFTNYLGATVASAVSVGTNDYFALAQAIEGYNVADLNFGSANAKTVTISFWVYSSLTGTFGASLTNGAEGRSYPFTYTISSANTWTQITQTIAGDTTGTWATGNTQGMKLFFGLGCGSTYAKSAGSWQTGTAYTATGATSVVGTNGATFYITGVQLEVGSTATSFDYRPYGTELALCQRYYAQSVSTVAASSLYNTGTSVYNVGWNYSGGSWVGGSAKLPITMRSTPSCTVYTNSTSASSTPNRVTYFQGSWSNVAAAVTGQTNENYISIENSGSSGSTGNNLIQFHYVASAEL
jgi:hypothetical protein